MGFIDDIRKKRQAKIEAEQAEAENAKKLAELQVDAGKFYELFKLKTSATQSKIGTCETFVNENNQEVVVAYTEYGPITRTKLETQEPQTTGKYMYEGIISTDAVLVPKEYTEDTKYGKFVRTKLEVGKVVPGEKGSAETAKNPKEVPSGYYAITRTRGFMRDPDDFDHYPNSITWHRHSGFVRNLGTGKASFVSQSTDERKMEPIDLVCEYFDAYIEKQLEASNKKGTKKVNAEQTNNQENKQTQPGE